MSRIAASIPMNISEGCGRGTESDFARFLQIAMISGSELEYQIIIVHNCEFIDDSQDNVLMNDLI